MNSKNSTSSLTQGAILSAITVVIYFASMYVPIFNIICVLGAHLPIVYMYYKHGAKYSVMVAVVVCAILFVLTGPSYAITYFLTNALVGFVLGYYTRNKRSSIVILGVLSLTILLSTGILLKIVESFLGADIISQLINHMISSFENSLSTLKELGVESSLSNINMKDFKDYLLMSVPSIALSYSIVMSYIYYIITEKSLKRFDVKLDKIPPFSKWYIPSIIAYPIMILFFITMFIKSDELVPLIITINTLFMLVFSLNALATVSYYLKEANFPKIAIVLIVAAVFLLLPSVIMFVGLFEYAFNLRRLDKKRASFRQKK